LLWLAVITARSRDEGAFSKLRESTEENDAQEKDAGDVICREPLPPTMMEGAQMGRPEHVAPAFPIRVC
jgi:hypothetical protein